jgi:hypothetical protein
MKNKLFKSRDSVEEGGSLLKGRRRVERRKNNERYTIGDFFMDVIFWIPELLFLPFRLLFFFARAIIRGISDLW